MLSVPRKSISSGSQLVIKMLAREDLIPSPNIKKNKRDDSRGRAFSVDTRPLSKKVKPSSPPKGSLSKKVKSSSPQKGSLAKKVKSSSPKKEPLSKKVKPSSPHKVPSAKKVKPTSPPKGLRTTTRSCDPTVTTGGIPPPKPEEVYRGKPNEDIKGGWPRGWLKTEVQRKSGGSRDRYWYSPGGKKFRSMIEINNFFRALSKARGDEDAAWKIFKNIKKK
jgi:Methyl-CpG binding domain